MQSKLLSPRWQETLSTTQQRKFQQVSMNLLDRNHSKICYRQCWITTVNCSDWKTNSKCLSRRQSNEDYQSLKCCHRRRRSCHNLGFRRRARRRRCDGGGGTHTVFALQVKHFRGFSALDVERIDSELELNVHRGVSSQPDNHSALVDRSNAFNFSRDDDKLTGACARLC